MLFVTLPGDLPSMMLGTCLASHDDVVTCAQHDVGMRLASHDDAVTLLLIRLAYVTYVVYVYVTIIVTTG